MKSVKSSQHAIEWCEEHNAVFCQCCGKKEPWGWMEVIDKEVNEDVSHNEL